MGHPLFVLSGGEPLLRGDIFGLAERAARQGLAVGLASNGTLIDAAAAGSIKESGIRRVSISLDGPDAAVHDVFRRQEGAFTSAVRGIAALREVEVPVQINVTVSRHNVDRLDDMVGLAKRVGAVALHFFLLVPVGCGLEIAEEQAISAEDYEDTLGWLHEAERREPTLQMRATCAPHYFRVVRQRRAAAGVGPDSEGGSPPSLHRQAAVGGPMHTATRGCLAGTGICFVSHTGKVYGCGYLPVEAGDIRRERLSAVWQDSPLLAELRDFDALKGACGVCGYKQVCGGCRARAYGVSGDYLAEEPFCSYVPPGTDRLPRS
jgi:radical SAM protein with 4Fe4S-binding SPASM domain